MAVSQHRGKRGFQSYGTPPEFLAAARGFLGVDEWDCDLAADDSNHVCPHYFTEETDAFTQNWRQGDGWNWLNPPFAKIGPWVEKAFYSMLQARAQTCLLLPAGVGSNWFGAWCHEKCVTVFLNGRITFLGTPPNPNTGKPDPYPKDLMMLLYSPYLTPEYQWWRWKTAHQREGMER